MRSFRALNEAAILILATGLTPAWQQIYSFSNFRLGEVNRADAMVACASGKVLNVGIALQQLRVPCRTICPIGGSTGKLIRRDCEKLAVDVRWTSSSNPIRTCTTILDLAGGKTTELVENSLPLTAAELDEYTAAVQEESRQSSVIVVSGSMPAGTPSDYYKRMLESIERPLVLDLRGAELQHLLSFRPLLVKPNREELARTVGRPLTSDGELVDAMSEIRQRGAEWVVVSQGEGTLLALGSQGLLRIEPPRVDVCNPIGCGDCLAAGIAAGIYLKYSLFDALQLGVRAAAENARHLLPARNLSSVL